MFILGCFDLTEQKFALIAGAMASTLTVEEVRRVVREELDTTIGLLLLRVMGDALGVSKGGLLREERRGKKRRREGDDMEMEDSGVEKDDDSDGGLSVESVKRRRLVEMDVNEVEDEDEDEDILEEGEMVEDPIELLRRRHKVHEECRKLGLGTVELRGGEEYGSETDLASGSDDEDGKSGRRGGRRGRTSSDWKRRMSDGGSGSEGAELDDEGSVGGSEGSVDEAKEDFFRMR